MGAESEAMAISTRGSVCWKSFGGPYISIQTGRQMITCHVVDQIDANHRVSGGFAASGLSKLPVVFNLR
jgi:hypothetical protein